MDAIPAIQGQYFPSMPPSTTAPSRFLDPGYGPPPPLRRISTQQPPPSTLAYPPHMTLPGVQQPLADTYTPQINIHTPVTEPQKLPTPQAVALTGPQLASGRAPGIAYGDTANANPFLQGNINDVRTKLGYLQYNVNELRYGTDILYDRVLAQRSWVNQLQYNLNDAMSSVNTLASQAR